MAALNFHRGHVPPFSSRRYAIPGSLQGICYIVFQLLYSTPVTVCMLAPSEPFQLVSVTGHTPSNQHN